MRLKSLRKEAPALEVQGALIRGNRINLSNNDLRSPRFRTQAAPFPPIDSNGEETLLAVAISDRNDGMSNNVEQNSDQTPEIPSSYHDIEAAYREHGIRIRLSPNKSTTPGATHTGRRSALSLRRPSTYSNRNPSRTSSVLNYSSSKPESDQDQRSFSALQHIATNAFESDHTQSIAFTQSTEVTEVSTSLVSSENMNPIRSLEKNLLTKDSTVEKTSISNDPDIAYLSSLFKTSAGQSYRETIRRRAGLRDTFAVHRHPVTNTPHQPTIREKSPPAVIHRSTTFHTTTIGVCPTLPQEKIDKDIVKHASRLRMSYYKDYQIRSPSTDSTPRISSSAKLSAFQRFTVPKSFQSISLEPLELLLSRQAPRSASLLSSDSPSILDQTRPKLKSRVKSAKTLVEKSKSMKSTVTDGRTSVSINNRDTPTLTKASSLNYQRQTNSFDSGYYDRSSSGGDVQSFTSSSVIQAPSSIPSVRLNSSTTRRSNTTKKVSFYDEPIRITSTTATYV